MDERREDYLANGKFDEIQRTLHEQAIVTSRLITITENQSKSIEAWEKWKEKHESEYKELYISMRDTKMQTTVWAEKLNTLEKGLGKLTDQVGQLVTDGLKIRGGWLAITLMGSIVMGGVSLVGLVLRILGVL